MLFLIFKYLALNCSPPTPTSIHPILTVPSALRSRSHMHLGWDVRYSPDTPSPDTPQNVQYSTRAPGNDITNPVLTRPRSNTQPEAQATPELALDLNARLGHNHDSPPQSASPNSPNSPVCVAGLGGVFSAYPVALEPATTPPRARMLIVCRDLLLWLIPIYAHDSSVGCTVLDVVCGIYTALQTPEEVPEHMCSGGPAVERQRVDWLRDKTVFVCLGRDEALVLTS